MPLTSNKIWQGRRFKTKDYSIYEKDLLRLLPKEECILGETRVEYIFGLPSLFRGDLDNFLKPLNDILVKGGYMEDDRYIIELHARKVKSKKPFIKIKIIKI